MQGLDGRVAVITGAGSGIGEALANACAAQGMRVVVADIHQQQAERVAAALQSAGAEALAVPTDVSDRSSVARLADQAYERFGAVHLLCNNAGVLVQGALHEASEQDWQWVLSVNLHGPINGLLAFLPRMLAAGGEAHIVNTASIAGVCILSPGLGVYTTAKYAVVGLSEMLRTELEPAGIGVSVLCPGGVNTQIFSSPRNRPAPFGGPVAVADAEVDRSNLMAPDQVAARVIDAVKANRLYVFTHPELRSCVEERFRHILADFDAVS